MVLAIMQARTSSSRFPRKVLKPILGKPMIVHEWERLKRSACIQAIVLATSKDASDDDLAGICQSYGVKVFRGCLDDVLTRYYQCALMESPDHVVRITGDCPVLDHDVVDKVIRQHMDEGNDYTVTTNNFPDGLDTEVLKFTALKKAAEEAMLPSEREHVTPYIRNHPDIFQIGYTEADGNWSTERWTVDEPRDFSFIEKIYESLYSAKADFNMYDVLELLRKRPELREINQGIGRNEGFLKSLQADEEYGKVKCNG